MKTRKMTFLSLIISLLSISCGNLCAESIEATGKVTDESGKVLSGASVYVKNTPSKGTVTNLKGEYDIEVNKGDTLVFRYFGYVPQTLVVNKKILNVIMSVDSNSIRDEVVVSALQTQRKITTLGAITSVNLESLSLTPNRFNNTEEYNSFKKNSFQEAAKEPLSTFSIDVDVASYGNMRRFINQGELPHPDAIRLEELINYFSYDYAEPTGKDPVKLSSEVGVCPWNKAHRLIKIGIKAKEIDSQNLPASNLVFLIDVSGSMWGPTRLDLVKSSLKLLVNNLRKEDRVSIVVYAGAAGEVLPSTPGNEKQKILDALNGLTAGGSTAGGAGIQLAYHTARNNFIKGGNNRVILCTDGDFNVGVSSSSGLENLIEKERKSGVFLTVLGYGMGNYKDNRMQVLAEKGNGNHAYIDNLQEANKVLVQEFGSTLHTVAKDVKLQIEFNPEQVLSYRLIGYESRLLDKEDFNDDTKDAGDMGAGHRVTAFYEIIPPGVKNNLTRNVDPLKYQEEMVSVVSKTTGSKELLTIKLRYKDPDKDNSRKIELPVTDNKENKTSIDFRFASAVVMFGQLLQDSEFKGDVTFEDVILLAKTALDNDEYGYKREFVRLVESAKGLIPNYLQ